MATSANSNSKGTNTVYMSKDNAGNRIVITWDDVGIYKDGTTPHAFQLIMEPGTDDGGMVFQYRYEETSEVVGSSPTNKDIAVGFNIGVSGGDLGTAYYELAYSDAYYADDDPDPIQLKYTDLSTRKGATTGLNGIWNFEIYDGQAVSILARARSPKCFKKH